jgi:hypothetical protein
VPPSNALWLTLLGVAPCQALDELKVLEYRLNNQGNSFRGSFQLNEFGYDYGRDVPEMSERERERALEKRRQLKQRIADLKVSLAVGSAATALKLLRLPHCMKATWLTMHAEHPTCWGSQHVGQ